MDPPKHLPILTLETPKSAEAPKDGTEESTDSMLANVDNFIDSVYRDLSMALPSHFSRGNAYQARRSADVELSSPSPPASTERAPLLSGTTPSGVSENVTSPVRRRNMDAEIERLNRICASFDRNLRSFDSFMNNSSLQSGAGDMPNTNLENTPPSSSVSSVSPSLFDLSNSDSEAPVELFGIDPFSNSCDDDDDDVILVSTNIPPVVDLCTPESNKPKYKIQEDCNRRRVTHNDNVDRTTRSSSSRRRRTESCLITSPPKVKKTSDNDEISPAATAGTPFMCPVCMESCLRQRPTSTQCGHVFCKECIERAIALTHKCPMCNKKISQKQTFRIYL